MTDEALGMELSDFIQQKLKAMHLGPCKVQWLLISTSEDLNEHDNNFLLHSNQGKHTTYLLFTLTSLTEEGIAPARQAPCCEERHAQAPPTPQEVA